MTAIATAFFRRGSASTAFLAAWACLTGGALSAAEPPPPPVPDLVEEPVRPGKVPPPPEAVPEAPRQDLTLLMFPKIKGKVTAGKAELNLHSPVTLHEVRVEDKQGRILLTIERMEFEQTLTELAVNRKQRGPLHLIRPQAFVEFRGGTCNFVETMGDWWADESRGKGLNDLKIEIVEGHLHIVHAETDRQWIVSPLNFACLPSGPTKQDRTVTADVAAPLWNLSYRLRMRFERSLQRLEISESVCSAPDWGYRLALRGEFAPQANGGGHLLRMWGTYDYDWEKVRRLWAEKVPDLDLIGRGTQPVSVRLPCAKLLALVPQEMIYGKVAVAEPAGKPKQAGLWPNPTDLLGGFFGGSKDEPAPPQAPEQDKAPPPAPQPAPPEAKPPEKKEESGPELIPTQLRVRPTAFAQAVPPPPVPDSEVDKPQAVPPQPQAQPQPEQVVAPTPLGPPAPNGSPLAPPGGQYSPFAWLAALDSLRELTIETQVGWERLRFRETVIGATDIPLAVRDVGVEIGPMKATLNEGLLTAACRIEFVDGRPVLRLPKGPLLSQVRLTPEMCHRVLVMAAPLMARAMKVEGSVSLILSGGIVPLDDPAAADVSGQLQVHGIRGELNPDLARIAVRLGIDPIVRLLDDNVTNLRFTEGRLYHEGMGFVMGDKQLYTRGSVGLDRTIDIIAEVTLPFAWLPNGPLGQRLKGTKLRIPVGGTFDEPKPGKVEVPGFDLGQLTQGDNPLGNLLRNLQDPAAGRPIGQGGILDRLRNRRLLRPQ